VKFIANAGFGAYKASHHRSIYFHNAGPEVDRAFERYISALAGAVTAFRERHRAFVILVAMEQLDARACAALAAKIGKTPVFTSEHYDMYKLVSILRACDLLVSSRYHAIVTTMPALVPSAGITMDERIRNIMTERGQEDLLMNVDDSDLEAKALAAMEKLRSEADVVRDGIAPTVVRNLKRMARMGVLLERNVHTLYPAFPLADGVRSWESYLPPLGPQLSKLAEMHDSRAQTVGTN
jgi:polysaccharide pyruvyl transferase WcaK-like protein